jgi:hypothetical protein
VTDGPGFDAAAWRQAQQPWIYRDRWAGRLRSWAARPVSADAVLAAQMEMQGASPSQIRKLSRRLFRLAFPRRPSMAWRGDPVALIHALPLPAWQAVLESFFESALGRASAKTMPVSSPPTSSSPTPAPPPAGSPSPPTS